MKVWDSDSGKELRQLQAHGGFVSSLAWSPDGRYLASASMGRHGEVRVAELDRSIALAQVAEDWDVPTSTLTLDYLAERAPEPARMMFEEHQQAFRQLVAEIEDTAIENRKLATSSLRVIQAALDDLIRSETGATYGATGLRETGPVMSHISKIL